MKLSELNKLDVPTEEEFDGAFAAVEGFSKEIDNISSLLSVMREQVNNTGKMNIVSVESLNLYLKTIEDRYEIPTSRSRQVVAVENFSNPLKVANNTKYALEAVFTSWKDVWNGFVKFITSIFNKIGDFWKKHIGFLGRSVKAGKTLLKAARKAKGKNITSEETSVPDSAQSVFGGNGPLKISHIKNMVIKQHKITTDIADWMKNFDPIIKAFSEVKDKASRDAAIAQAKKFVSQTGGEIILGTAEDPICRGNFGKIVILVEEGGIDIDLQIEKEAFTLTKNRQFLSGESGEVKDLVENINALTDLTIGMKKGFEHQREVVTRSLHRAGRHMERAENEKDEELKANFEVIKSSIVTVSTKLQKVNNVMVNLNSDVIRAGLYMSELCIKLDLGKVS